MTVKLKWHFPACSRGGSKVPRWEGCCIDSLCFLVPCPMDMVSLFHWLFWSVGWSTPTHQASLACTGFLVLFPHLPLLWDFPVLGLSTPTTPFPGVRTSTSLLAHCAQERGEFVITESLNHDFFRLGKSSKLIKFNCSPSTVKPTTNPCS